MLTIPVLHHDILLMKPQIGQVKANLAATGPGEQNAGAALTAS